MAHLTTEELQLGLDHIRRSPTDRGTVEMIVSRPAVDGRVVLTDGRLDAEHGLIGDSWRSRNNGHAGELPPDPDRQLTVMNARVIALMARDREQWPLAGDQLYVDLDLSDENLPPGSQLTLGSAVIEVTEPPHNGCAKFRDRFGTDAVRFVNSPDGKALHLRGINAKVVQPGTVRQGDTVTKR